jgi:hypothetical protein
MTDKSSNSLIRFLIVPGVFILFQLIFSSCSSKIAPSGNTSSASAGLQVTGPNCIIYKTSADFSGNVPVGMSEDKTQISSFPDVKDIYFDGKLAEPTQLVDGYLLDNRGIGPNVAFISITYEEYSRLKKTPTAEELLKMVISKDPLVEMYQCGKRNEYAEIPGDLNELINSGRLKGCKKLK